MLPRKQRLARSADIQHVLRRGRCFQVPGMRICVAPGATQSRVACIVSKKVSRLAVRRHRYQRWLRSLAKELLAGPLVGKQYDMVLVATPQIKQWHTLADLQSVAWSKLKRLGSPL